MCGISEVLNPASILRDAVGGTFGAVFDPVGAIAAETGGVFGHFLDPAQATENLIQGKGDLFGTKPAASRETPKQETVLTHEEARAQDERLDKKRMQARVSLLNSDTEASGQTLLSQNFTKLNSLEQSGKSLLGA